MKRYALWVAGFVFLAASLAAPRAAAQGVTSAAVSGRLTDENKAAVEQAVKEFKLSPDQYQRSIRLREWARRNKNSKYIPEPLLEAWGFEIESTL